MTDVMGYGGSAALMDMEVKVYDAISATRLLVIGDGQIGQLSDAQKQQLLIVRFSASQSDEESVVSINFVDYVTGRPVASCRGAFGFGWTKDHDMEIAIDKAIEQMKNLFLH
jgi:ribosomal protein S5